MLKITSKNSNDIRLTDLVSGLPSLSQLKWRIYWLYAMGSFNSEGIRLFEDRLKESETGLAIEFEDLIRMDNELDQTIEIVIAASDDEDVLNQSLKVDSLKEEVKIFLEKVDGQSWEVYGDQELLSHLQQELGDRYEVSMEK